MMKDLSAIKTGVPLSIEVGQDGKEVLGFYGVNYDSEKFRVLMDFAYKAYEEAHTPKVPVKSNAPSMD
jgi:hypothetical protein